MTRVINRELNIVKLLMQLASQWQQYRKLLQDEYDSYENRSCHKITSDD